MTWTFGQRAEAAQQPLISLVMETWEGTELCFPQMLNTSCKKPKYPDFEIMLIYTVLSSISLLTVTLNLLVIISISHFR